MSLVLFLICGSLLFGSGAVTFAQTVDELPSDSRVDGPGADTDDSGEDGSPTFGGGVDSSGRIDATVSTPGSGGGGGSSPGPATYAPSCTWTPASTTALGGIEIPTGGGNGDVTAQIEDENGRLGWLRFCPGDLEAVFVWLAPVDPIDLVPDARRRATAQLPLPVPNMSPPADVGSVVNLGLWFSVEDPGVTTARATLTPSVWAEVTGRFGSVAIVPGDGADPIVCDGLGVAYTDGSDTFDQGPCGHTYTSTSPDSGFTMTYTITYELTWRTSDGRSGSAGTFPLALPFQYDVDEIQTIGTSPG